MKKNVVVETAGDGAENSLEEKKKRGRPPQAAGDAPAPNLKKLLTISSNQVAAALNKSDVPASAAAVNRNVKRRLPPPDRANIVGRCAMEAGYTSEEHTTVVVLMGSSLAVHPASAIVTDVGQDAISCHRCKLKRTGIQRNGNNFRGSPCPEEVSTSKRAMWITGVCNIRTREEADNQRWGLQCLMKAEHKKADVKQMGTSAAAET